MHPRRHRREQGPDNGWPRLSRGEGRRRHGLEADRSVEDDEVEDHGLHPVRNELMIKHPDFDPDVTLHLGNLEESLVARQVVILEDEDAPDKDVPGDRLTLELEVS